MKALNVEIQKNVQVSDRYWHMVIYSPELASITSAGEFYHIRCSEQDYPFLRRPFSIYRINKDEGTLEFLYLIKGAGTKKLTDKTSGEKVNILGPLGEGFTLNAEWNTILLVARGVGIATLAALAQEAGEKGIRCVAILSARKKDDLLATEELQSLGAEVHKVTEEDGTSDVKNVEYLLEKIMDEYTIDAAFTCGSKRLSKLLQNITTAHNIYSEIALEENMGCAMGVCYACVCDIVEGGEIKSVRVCREGPVFNLEKVVLDR